jgi:transcriptional regulator with XRE-family HTH domain
MNVAQQIRQLRLSKGWGPDDLATQASISRTALHHIESGKTGVPRAATLSRIAKALGVEPKVLLQDKEEVLRAVQSRQRRSELKADHVESKAIEPSRANRKISDDQGWLRELELERKYRILLRSPLRDAMIQIVESLFRPLPPETRDTTY